MSSFTAIGAKRAGYDWRRHAVSSLADGPGGWLQRANFIVTGSLFCIAAHGLALSPNQIVGPRVVPALTFGVGAGLIGSGLFVTDPVAGYPPLPSGHDQTDRTQPVAPSREGTLHNLCASPDLRRDTDRGLDLRCVRRAHRGLSLGFLLGRLSDRDDEYVRAVRRSVRWRATPRRPRRSSAARLDCDWIRMAERAFPSRADLCRQRVMETGCPRPIHRCRANTAEDQNPAQVRRSLDGSMRYFVPVLRRATTARTSG